MARLVNEIMNRELFSARATHRVGDLLGYFAALGITASPVVAEDGSVAGMISLRDLVDADPHEFVLQHMNKRVMSVRDLSTIEEAARLIGESNYHRLPVIDAAGMAVGIVSSLDVIRGLIGMPKRHPAVFPHYDKVTGVSWTDDVALDYAHVENAPDRSGVLALVHGGVGVTERVVWAEMSNDVRARLGEMLSVPEEQPPALRGWLEKKSLRFRAARLGDWRAGARIVDLLQRQAR